ncbi:phosphoribosylaminoimidazolesuccinocarboxamide synthase [bacterium]|nr:phosphoribosylaminoimidazolesuccinocarboxamide synthase [bacterium]
MPQCPLIKQGKVRDIYQLDNALLMVATDRISAFDFILPTPIHTKGIILTQISLFWFDFFNSAIPNHIIEHDFNAFPEFLQPYKSTLEGRSIIIKKAEVFPIECVVRGYLAGSGYNDYIKTGSVCTIKLPTGLAKGSQLPEPIFTPATKADEGHDENISFEEAAHIIGTENANKLKNMSIEIYSRAREYALTKGIIIADTKFEFGVYNGEIILIDEVLTPDSSRFWPANHYHIGKEQPSYDKQFVRDYLESINWNKKPPVPELPVDIVSKTIDKYKEAYHQLTNKNLI